MGFFKNQNKQNNNNNPIVTTCGQPKRFIDFYLKEHLLWQEQSNHRGK